VKLSRTRFVLGCRSEDRETQGVCCRYRRLVSYVLAARLPVSVASKSVAVGFQKLDNVAGKGDICRLPVWPCSAEPELHENSIASDHGRRA
jgi:hypothetical protein